MYDNLPYNIEIVDYCDVTSAYLCSWGSDLQSAAYIEPIKMPFAKEPCIRCGSRSDESIRGHEGWRVGDAAFCHITLDILN